MLLCSFSQTSSPAAVVLSPTSSRSSIALVLFALLYWAIDLIDRI